MKRGLADAISSSQILRFYRIPIIIVFAGTLCAIIAYVAVIMYDVAALQRSFTYIAETRVQALQKELENLSASLDLGGNAMQAQQHLEDSEFQTIAASMMKQSAFSSILLVENRQGEPKVLYQQGMPDDGAVTTVLTWLRKHSDAGMTSLLTAELHKNSAEESSTQMALVMPVPGNLRQPARHVVGLFHTAFLFNRMNDWQQSAEHERIYIYDHDKQLLYSLDRNAGYITRIPAASIGGVEYNRLLRESGFFVEIPVMLGDMRWTVVMLPTSGYVTGVWRGMSLVVLIGGLLLVGLLGYERFQAATYGMRTALEVERKTLELSASEARLRNIFDHAVDGLITINDRGLIESFNPACERMFGYSAQEVMGRNISMLMPEPYHSEHDRYIHNFQSTGVPRIIGIGREVEARHKDGHIFPIELGVSEVNIAGKVFYSGILRDITARRAAEKATGLLAAIVEFSDDAIISKTPDGYITSWNIGAERLFGYAAEEVVGKPVSILIPLDRQDEENYIMNMLRKGKSVQHYETVRLAKDNRSIAISLTVSPIYDEAGNIIGASKVARDITERRAQERKLKDANKFLEDMMNHIPDPIFMKDRQHRWIGGNRAFWALMNGPPEKFLGKSDYEFFPKEEADLFWERDDLVFTSGEALINEEYFTDAHGKRHAFSTKKMAFLNERGEQFLVGVIRDITERKTAEAEREKLIAQLTVSNTELERFAYICSHDLQEPLRMIANYTQRLSQHLQGNLDEKGSHYMNYVVQGANNARMLISDVLTFARIGAETEKIDAADAAEVLAMVMHTLEESIRSTGVKVTYDKLPKVEAHRTHVVQLLQNLINNAIKFRGKENPSIHIGVERQGDMWRFSVQDNGIGISSDYKNKVFEIFQRLHKRSEYPGTGIGLAVCKKIVEQYNGEIYLDSETGKGSTFYFTLPAAKIN